MKYLNLEWDNVGLEYGFTSSVSYKKDNPLLELTLNFQISFVLHLDEAVQILYKLFTTVSLNETTTTLHKVVKLKLL